jgi:uncharacterized membrane protein/rhamnogalacturonyl hydrolase YesR
MSVKFGRRVTVNPILPVIVILLIISVPQSVHADRTSIQENIDEGQALALDSNIQTSGRGLPPDVNPHLYHAEAAARWLISIAVEPSPSHYKWYASDVESNKYCLELSLGASGIGGFFLKLYQATDNDTYLEYAEGAARWLISKAEPAGPDALKWSYWEGMPYYSPDKFGGVGAIGEFLLALYQETSNSSYLDYSRKGAHWLMSIATPQYGGYKWELSPGFDFNFTGWAHGVAGICDFFRQLALETSNSSYWEYANGGAIWLIAIARNPAPDQYTWVRIETDADPEISWCGGTTGITLFFMLMYESTGNQTYLDYAIGGGNWMISQATNLGSGKTTFMSLNIFCHGDPSCSYVMAMLYDTTGNGTYLRYAEESANWTISTGTQVTPYEMKWPIFQGSEYYEPGLLRGASGVGHQMLYLYNISGKERYLDYARLAAGWVENISVEVSPGVEKWNWEERLGQPDQEFFPGWYYGAAGIGLFLIEMIPFWTPPTIYGVDIVEPDIDLSAKPGEQVVAEFTVNNTGNTVDSCALDSSWISPGWTLEVDFDGADLAPDENRSITVNITVSPDAFAGHAESVTFHAKSVGDPNATDNITITVLVEAIFGVDILDDDQEGAALPEETATYEIYIRNTGNSVDGIVLDIPATAWPVDVLFDGVDLAPNESRVATINVTPPAALHAGNALWFEVNASSTGDQNISDTIGITTTVEPFFGIDIIDTDMTGETGPGETVSYKIDINNTGNAIDDFEVSALSPSSSWTFTTAFDGKDMEPGEVRTAVVNVTPPDGAPGDSEETVLLRATSQGDQNLTDEISITTKVLHVFGVDVLAPANQSVLPGRSVAYSFVVTNTGNTNDSYEISATSEHDWPVEIEGANSTETLGAEQSATVTIRVSAPSFAVFNTIDELSLRATSVHETAVIAGSSVSTTVLPQYGMSLTTPSNQKTIKSDEKADFTLVITNEGNLESSFIVKTLGDPALNVSISEGPFHLGINASKTVGITVTTAMDTEGNFTFELQVETGNVSKSVTFTVNVEGEEEPPVTVEDSWLPFALLIVIMIIVVLVIVGYLIYMKKDQATRERLDRETGEEDSPGEDQEPEDEYREDR